MGGEPLLNYGTIKECVLYANQLFNLKTISYSLTTNGALLNEDVLKFFEQNNVTMHISIDGPKHIDDKHRRFLINGNGTFDLVNNNILMIKNKFPAYFNDYVSFISVIYPDENIDEIYNYFKTLGVSIERVNIRPVNSFGTDLKYDQRLIQLSQCESCAELNEFEREDYNKFLKKINDKSNIQKKSNPNGMCIPERDKLYVTVNGDFFPCEKVNEKNSYIKIGNLAEGFDETKIIELINLPKITESECKKCWAFRFCEMCICHCEDYTCGISKSAKLQECKKQKQKIEKYMIKYIKEKG